MATDHVVFEHYLVSVYVVFSACKPLKFYKNLFSSFGLHKILLILLEQRYMSFVSINFEQVVKVADFGVARVQTESGVMTAETGTYRWMAPEVLLLCLVIFFWLSMVLTLDFLNSGH